MQQPQPYCVFTWRKKLCSLHPLIKALIALWGLSLTSHCTLITSQRPTSKYHRPGLGLQHMASGRIKTFSPLQRERRKSSVNELPEKDCWATYEENQYQARKRYRFKAQVDRQQAMRNQGVKTKKMRTPRKGEGGGYQLLHFQLMLLSSPGVLVGVR